MKYLIVGDVHGLWSDLFIHIKNVILRGIEFDEIIQVGDFGIYIGCVERLKQSRLKFNFKKPIHFVDGNHEDHLYLSESISNLEKIGIHYHKRSTITKLDDGTKIGWMGGAFNVDRPQFKYANTFYNFPSAKELLSMSNIIKKYNGVDLMVTHSCPMGIGVGMMGHLVFQKGAQKFIGELGYPVSELNDSGDFPLTSLWENLDGYRPKTWVFGHYHQDAYSKVEDTEFVCVGHCGGAGVRRMPRIYIYDTEMKELMK